MNKCLFSIRTVPADGLSKHSNAVLKTMTVNMVIMLLSKILDVN